MKFGQRMMARIGSAVLAVAMSITLFPKISGAEDVRADDTSATTIEYDLTSGTFNCDSTHSDVLLDLLISGLLGVSKDTDCYILDIDIDGNEDIYIPTGTDSSIIKAKKTNIRGTYTFTKEQIDLGYDEVRFIFTNEVLVTYDVNGGTKGAKWVDSEYVTPPTDKEISKFSVNGKEFNVGAQVVINEATTIKYLWKDEVKMVNATIDLNGGTLNVSLPLTDQMPLGSTMWFDSLSLSEDVVTPPDGCKFDGFEIEGVIYLSGDSYHVTHDFTMKIHWAPAGTEHYPIIYNANGGITGKDWETFVNVIYGTKITLNRPSTDVVKPQEGKELSHFLVNDVEYPIGSEITITVSTRIKYIWKDASPYVKMTIDPNGGVVSPSCPPLEETYKRGSTFSFVTIPEELITPPQGYVLDGYEIEGKFYAVGASYTINYDIVAKLVWLKVGPELFTITYDANGGVKGSNWQDTLTILEGSTIILAAPDASIVSAPEGKEFDGFEIAGVKRPAGTNYTIAGNVTIKYLWKDAAVTPEPQPVTPEPQPVTPEPQPAKDPSFEDFIERMYVVALNRQSEPEGKAFWMDKVKNEGFTGGRVAIGFLIEAPEFLNRGLTDEQFVEVLYKTFFDREADEGGKAFWMGHLASDMTREQVVRGFIDSTEWCNLCAYYGVKSGAPNAKAEKPSNNAMKFATRLYTECLGREPDADGLLFWALRLTNLESSGYEAAKGFFESKEFTNKNVDDTTYVKLLYRTFMGRDYDQGGLEFWLGHLATDMNRLQVLQGFAQSQEFTNICNEYGIDRGTI